MAYIPVSIAQLLRKIRGRVSTARVARQLVVWVLAVLFSAACRAQTIVQYADLHTFGGTITDANGGLGLDGKVVPGSPIFDSAGNMYGIGEFGGSGMVWELTAAGVYKDLHDFGGTVVNANGTSGLDGIYGNIEGYQDPGGGFPVIALDSVGNLYGIANSGGAYGSTSNPRVGGMVWEITVAGKYKDLHDFGGTVINASGKSGPDTSEPMGMMTIDAGGNLYGTSYGGGPFANFSDTGGNVWEITNAGVYKDLHDFGGSVANANGKTGPDGDAPQAIPLLMDGYGNLYGATTEGGPYSLLENLGLGNLWEITKAGVYRDLYDFGGSIKLANGTMGTDTGSGSQLVIDSTGDLYWCSYNDFSYANGSLMKWTPTGVVQDLHDFGGTVTNANGKSGPDGFYPMPVIALGANGAVYGACQVGGPNSTIFSSDGSGMVWEFSPTTGYHDLHDFGGTVVTSSGPSGLDGVCDQTGVTLDPSGNLYGTTVYGGYYAVSSSLDGGNVWEITAAGAYKDLHDFGSTVNGPSGGVLPDNGEPPLGVLMDKTGNLYGTAYTGDAAGDYSEALLWKVSQLVPPTLSNLSLGSTTVIGGTTATSATVSLSSPALPGGFKVTLASSSTIATVPTSVTVAAGASSATFSIGSNPVAVPSLTTLSAAAGTVKKTAVFEVLPPTLLSIAVSPTSVIGGTSATGTVTLSGPAPTGGTVVALSSNSVDAVPSASVTVAAGSTTATFTIKSVPVSPTVTATVKATLGTGSKSASLTVKSATMASVKLSVTSVVGSSSTAVTGTVTLTGPAPAGGAAITLTSSTPTAASVPTSVQIAAGATTATFTVSHYSVTTTQAVTFKAVFGTQTLTAGISVAP